MTRRLFIAAILLAAFQCHATNTPPGFLWYNVEKPQSEKKLQEKAKPKGVPFNQLSYTDRDNVLKFYTMEALHKAHHTKKMKDMKTFLALQDYWLKESSQFSNLFQKTMLHYPQYDYSVTHPASNIGTKTLDEVREEKRTAVIKDLSKTHGLLFFYRGNSAYDLKQIPIIRDFITQFNLSMISFRVDEGEPLEGLPHSKRDTGQAEALGVRYFPALLLVNPKSQKTLPVAFGLTTADILFLRLYKAATHFKGEYA